MLVSASRMLMRNVSADFCASTGVAPATRSDPNRSIAASLLRTSIVAFSSTSLGGQMTLYHRSLLADHGQRRRAAAVLDSDAAARMEAATWRNVGGIGQRLAEADVRHAETRLRRQHACQQRLRIRVAWRPKQSVGLVALDEAAEIHDRDLARHVFDHGEVMADE